MNTFVDRLCVVIFTTTLCSASLNAEAKTCDGTYTMDDDCPKVRAEVTPALFQQSPADHTYVKFLGENGKWQSYSCYGACKDGTTLEDTESATWEDNRDIIRFMADASPCRWPKYYYLIIGVCHQLANRGLFHTGQIVKSARMYEWSSFVYDTYGACFWPLKEYCMSSCREESAKVGQWEPGAQPTCLSSGMKDAKPADPDAEYQLYMEHFGDQKAPEDKQKIAGLMKLYRDQLLTLHAQQRLGDKYWRKYVPILSDGQYELLEKKKDLDLRLLKEEKLSDDIIKAYNELFNESLAQFREQMPKEIYEKFFGLAYDQMIDVSIFSPQD